MDASFDPNEDRSDYVRSGVIPCLVLAILSTILRLVAKRMQNLPINVADMLIIAALISGICEGALVFEGIKYGFGRHVSTVSPADLTVFLKIFFAAEVFYITTISFAKFSILVFYVNIFPGKKFALAAKIIGAVVLAWAVGCFFGVIFTCVPVQAFWQLELRANAYCIDSTKFFIGNAVPNMFTDAAILILPMSKVWHLQMSTQKKIAVSTMFLLGSFVIIASILRLALLAHQDLNDPTFGLVNAFTWSNIEVDIAILSANLPTLRPLVHYFFGGAGFSSNYGKHTADSQDHKSASRSHGLKSWQRSNKGDFEVLDDSRGKSFAMVSSSVGAAETDSGSHDEGSLANGIFVQREIQHEYH